MKVQKRWKEEKYLTDIFEEFRKKKENGITRGKKNTEVCVTKYSVINFLNSSTLSMNMDVIIVYNMSGKYGGEHWHNAQGQGKDVRKIYIGSEYVLKYIILGDIYSENQGYAKSVQLVLTLKIPNTFLFLLKN